MCSPPSDSGLAFPTLNFKCLWCSAVVAEARTIPDHHRAGASESLLYAVKCRIARLPNLHNSEADSILV